MSRRPSKPPAPSASKTRIAPKTSTTGGSTRTSIAPKTTAPGPSRAGVARRTVPSKMPACPAAAEGVKKEIKNIPYPEQPKAYENPAFSIPLKRVYTNPLLAEKDAKKTIRRNKPPGEDIAELKKIQATIKERSDITIGEYIALIAPSTGDNGDLLRKVLTEEMNSFRKLARKIYDTMTQDVSDVLTNQQIQLREFEQERITLYTEKMMRAINEIYSYAPKFDFEQYYSDPKKYLENLFPIPTVLQADSEEAEMHRRQQAFHRLNWLSMEGDRLAAENKRLQARLRELKNEQRQEIMSSETREAEAEARRQQLEAEEQAVHKQLDDLTDRVGETMVDTEAAIRVATDEANIMAPKRKKSDIMTGAEGLQRRRKKPDWTSNAAVDIEEHGIEENVLAEGAQSEAKAQSVAGAIKKVRSKTSHTKIRTPPKKQRSPFHFSPIKTPPPKPPKERSPFHFSPIKTPPRQAQQPPEPLHFSPPHESTIAPPELHTTRVRREKLSVIERRDVEPPPPDQDLEGATALPPPEAAAAAPPQPRRGRQYAPKDSWGGFY